MTDVSSITSESPPACLPLMAKGLVCLPGALPPLQSQMSMKRRTAGRLAGKHPSHRAVPPPAKRS